MAEPLITVLACLVIGISDGDSLTARCETLNAMQNLKVRLAEIDAPERRQAFGQRSRQSLAGLCFRKRALVHMSGVDRYGRTVARVHCHGVDASVAQVRFGMAWAFTRYLKDPAIAREEKLAREQRIGLWADPDPMAPWTWRQLRSAGGGSPSSQKDETPY
jgi:endonuclease YncB( thermonuclease family)